VLERDAALAELVETVLREAGYAVQGVVDEAAVHSLPDLRQFALALWDEGRDERTRAATAALAAAARDRGLARAGWIGDAGRARALGLQALRKPYRPGDLLDFVARCLA
jgi:hypothetical protein